MNDLMSERQNLDLLERTYDTLMSNNVGTAVNIIPTFLHQEKEYHVKASTRMGWITSSTTAQQTLYQTLFILPMSGLERNVDYINNNYITSLSIKMLESSGNYRAYKEDQQPKAGTSEYIKTIIGEKAFSLLSKNDKNFLINSAGIFNLGENVDIEGMLKRLDDE